MVSGLMIKNTARERKIGQMEQHIMRANTKKTKNTARERKIGQMEHIMRANTKKTKSTARES
jgi:hypothetical protein